MNDELKRKLVNELGECAQEFNKSIVNELQNSIEGIEKYYNLTDEELADLLDVPEKYFINMFDTEDADGDIDLRTISILTLLSNGRLSVLTDTPSGEFYNRVNLIIKKYKDNENSEDKSNEITNKIVEILNMFGVKTESDLDGLLAAVTNVKGLIDDCEHKERQNKCNCHNCDKNETKPNKTVYVNENGNFSLSKQDMTEKECNQENENKSSVKGFIYDSQTMDKPKEFDLKDNLDKLIPVFNDFFKKLF